MFVTMAGRHHKMYMPSHQLQVMQILDIEGKEMKLQKIIVIKK